MKRFNLNNLQNKRRQLYTGATKPPETKSEPFFKFPTKKLYTKEEIKSLAKSLFSNYGYNYDQQFQLVETVDGFNLKVEPGKPIFIIFSKKPNHWVLLCVVKKQNGRNIVLYKDPSGTLVSYKLEKKLRKHLEDLEFEAQTAQDQESEDLESYAPLTLRNLEIVLRLYRQNPEELVQNFPKLEFSKSTDLYSEFLNNVARLVQELAQNEEFKLALKDFINKIPFEIGDQMLKYKEVLEEELSKSEDSINHQRISEIRAEALQSSKIQEFQNNYEMVAKKSQDDIKDYELQIQNKFPDEMSKLTEIFDILLDAKTDSDLDTALRTICQNLDIDYKNLERLLKYQTRKNKDSKQPILAPDDIKTIAAKLPKPKNLPPQKSTPLEQLLQGTTLGKDPEVPTTAPKPTQDLETLRTKYFLVKNKYKQWENSTIKEISTWAKAQKGKLGTTDETICEVVAIMDRAFNLLTTWRLRDPQILATLIFLSGGMQGTLGQIQTGEGKTVIVSLLAVVKVLQGLKVDVITSNSVLALDGVNSCKTFYSVFGITVATNNPKDCADMKTCYSADVLYGSISNFQFDYLRDSFEGYNIRNGRKFGQVILDEVDSMLVDNGGHIAKLAEPFPGMECLRYIYIKIWQELHQAEERFAQEIRTKVQNMIAKNEPLEQYLQEVMTNEEATIAKMVKDSQVEQIPLIPPHLTAYVQSKVDLWIRNAIYAKYHCFEHQQYRLIYGKNSDEKIVVPVDYMNTGITLRNTIWSHGLHQFVQLKHNLRLTFESLTSSFISNIGYIRKYSDKNIYGMTGTLGSRAEQDLLSHIYNVTYAKIPTFKPKNFQELPSLVVEDDLWSNRVAVQATEMVESGRSVLVICETEHDLKLVQDDLTKLQEEAQFTMRIYSNEEMVSATEDAVQKGEVILATNIAGRGTDFKTVKELEQNGGLHVCVGFLPYNLRVEGQAFGRTSRQGKSGTANLIIRRSEVDELGLPESESRFAEIKKERDVLEHKRLAQIDHVLVKEINFKDALFELFSDYQRSLKEEKGTEIEFGFVLRDLREFWAFWFDRKNFNGSNVGTTTPQKEFDEFLAEAQTITNGKISHNPYYCIGLAQGYLEEDQIRKASQILEHARILSGNDEFLTGAHLKLFQIAILNGGQVMERFKKAIAAVFFIKVEKNEGYKTQATTFLNSARRAVSKEITYIEQLLQNETFQKILIATTNENYFLKHVQSRLICLKSHQANIDQLLEKLSTEPEGLDLGGVAITSVKNFDSFSTPNLVTGLELKELHLIGIDSLYALRAVHDVPGYVIATAQAQIFAGITSLTIGLCFPPAFPILGPLAGTLISEGLTDIVMEILVNHGDEEFDTKDFVKGKIITYAVSAITLGIGAIVQSTRILAAAVKLCRKFSSFLRRSKYLQTLCGKLANAVDKLGNYLDKALELARFSKLSKSEQLSQLTHLKSGDVTKFEQLGGLKKLTELEKLKAVGKLRELTRLELLGDFSKNLVLEFGKKAGKRVTEQLVLIPLVKSAVGGFVEQLKELLKDSLKRLTKKLKSAPKKRILEVADDFVKTDFAGEVCEKLALEVVGKLDSTTIDSIIVLYNTIRKLKEIDNYVKSCASYLDQHLEEGDADNDVDAIMEEVASKVAERIHSVFYDLFDAYFTYPKNLFKRYAWPKIKEQFRKPPPDEGTPPDTSQAIVPYRPPLTTSVQDSFKTLGLEPTASLGEIKRNYKMLYLKMEKSEYPGLRSAYEKAGAYAKGKKQEEGSTGVIVGTPDGVLTVGTTIAPVGTNPPQEEGSTGVNN